MGRTFLILCALDCWKMQFPMQIKVFRGTWTITVKNEKCFANQKHLIQHHNYLVKKLRSELYCVIHDSITTVKANPIFLANKPAADPSCLIRWSAGLAKGKLTRQYTKSIDVDVDKAWKIKSADHCTNRQISNVKVLLHK